MKTYLRNDTDDLPQTLKGDVLNLLAIDEDSATLHLVEPVEQPQDCALARPTRPDDRHLFACRDGERQVFEDRAVGVVPERDILKLDLASLERQRLGPRSILDRHVLALDAEEDVHVDQTLPELAVHRPEEVERERKLEDELVDHDEIADRHSACKKPKQRRVSSYGKGGRGDQR